MENKIFGDPSEELVRRANKLIGPNEAILGIVTNSDTNRRNCCYQKVCCHSLVPCLCPLWMMGGVMYCWACCILDQYLVFKSEIFVFTEKKIYVDIGNKGTGCLAQAEWTTREDGVCGKPRPPIGTLKYSQIKNMVTDHPPEQTICARCFPQTALCLYINNYVLATHAGETKYVNMRPIWVDDPVALKAFILQNTPHSTVAEALPLVPVMPQPVEMVRGDDPYVALQKLKDLLDAGVLNEKEFNEKKSKILETI